MKKLLTTIALGLAAAAASGAPSAFWISHG